MLVRFIASALAALLALTPAENITRTTTGVVTSSHVTGDGWLCEITTEDGNVYSVKDVPLFTGYPVVALLDTCGTSDVTDDVVTTVMPVMEVEK